MALAAAHLAGDLTACRMLLATAAFVGVAARLGHNYAFGSIGGYYFALQADGQWFLNETGKAAPLATGKLPPAAAAPAAAGSAPAWHNLSLTVAGASIAAAVGGVAVARAESAAWSGGYAGLATGWHAASFGRMAVAPAEAAA